MKFSFCNARGRALLLACLLGLSALASPASAAAAPAASPQLSSALPQAPAPLYAGFTDGVLGNRTRMIQFTFIGFAIGVAILMTATRKH